MAYKAHALKLGSNWIGGILNSQFTNQANLQVDPTAGSPYPQITSIAEVNAGFKFTSYNVAAALSAIGFLGLPLAVGTVAELYEILNDDNGFISAGATHRKVSFNAGRVIWRTITCQNRQDAQIEIEVIPMSSDGLTNPATFTESVTVPTVVDSARHTIASVQLGSISMGCVLDLRIDSGFQISAEACNSNMFDTRMALTSIIPKITVTTLNSQLVGSTAGKINITGAAATHPNTAIKLRKRIAKTGTFVADATAEHISITSDGIIVPTQPFSANNNQDGTAQFELTSSFDGTNLPLVINAASAL